jgi:NTE family protein
VSNDDIKKPKKIALALGGGGARGCAHIGIFQVLEREGIKIDSIAGTSMGAIIGGMYAAGYSVDKMKEIAMNFQHLNINPTKYLNILHESLFKSDFIEESLIQIFGDKKFEECKIPFTAVAVDLEAGEEVFFKEGLLKDAIKASASIPIIFPPTFNNDQYLIDGGVLNNVPLTSLREQNPDVLLGVKLVNFTSKQYISGMVFKKYYQQKYKNLFKKVNFLNRFVNKRKQDLQFLAGIAIRALDIASKYSTDMKIAQAKPDLLIEPQVACGLLEFDKAEEAIEQGRESMEEALPKLKEILYGEQPEDTDPQY